MQTYELYFLLLKACWVFFVFAFGACLGSLVNVLVYRLPRGLGVVTPSSSCPACETKLTWRENIPILGWIILRGKCRFCKSRISPEYPLVEAFVALLFTLFFVLWYTLPAGFPILGFNIGDARPLWTRADLLDAWPRQTWPLFMIVLMLLASLTAMTLVDAKTFTIPLSIPHAATLIALGLHVAYAAYLQFTGRTIRVPNTAGQIWSIPLPRTWGSVGMALGGALGVVVSILLVRFGLIRRSFLDYDEWETKARAELEPAAPPAPGRDSGIPPTPPAVIGAPTARREAGMAGPPDIAVGEPHLWIQYPYARREMVKELIFLTPCIALAWLGAWLFGRFSGSPPLLLSVFGGVLLGYLIGGGIVWAVRILGSLAFGREAMGLGDVHLMAAVGACVGWDVAVLGFFGAAFVGLAWVPVGRLLSGKVARAMPYGPFLAVATVLVLIFRPLIDRGLNLLLHP